MAALSPLQFDERLPGVVYRDRPCAFGVVEVSGRLALVRISREGEAPYLDLPGGALDPGETEEGALIREFAEETGLKVRPDRLLTRADQVMVKSDGDAVHNRSAFFRAHVESEAPQAKIEDDHALVWLPPVDALAGLRHDSHAWAVATLLRLDHEAADD